MKQAILGYILYLVPKNLLSFLVGLLVHTKLPTPLAGWSVRWFAGRYNINLDEAEYPIGSYPTIGQLFTRKLKSGLRPIASGVVHPADAVLTMSGRLLHGELIQAKGKKYHVSEFLGEAASEEIFQDGHFFTYYLCPTDYHRVHFPVSGQVEKVDYIPGRLWPVNPWSVGHISQLFSVNERVVVWMNTERGRVAVVMVGATNVGRMTLSFEPSIVTNSTHWKKRQQVSFAKGFEVVRGEELGVFNMGSTVIVVGQKEFVSAKLPVGEYPVKVGGSLEELLR